MLMRKALIRRGFHALMLQTDDRRHGEKVGRAERKTGENSREPVRKSKSKLMRFQKTCYLLLLLLQLAVRMRKRRRKKIIEDCVWN